ncbi:MAG: Holliday junction resolvase RuvX [Eubacterium sp.]|nr:Holliday junction resolvase RuvX [Eubacterium sp.]
MRIMGLDFGSKTVGVAVSDPLGITAQGVEIVRRKSPNKLRQTLARIQELVEQYEVTELVLGYPKNMNGTEGERCEKTKEFKELLEKRTGLPVALWDERLTTVAADRSMMEAGLDYVQRKEHVDEIAAIFILQGYMAAKEMRTEAANDVMAAEERDE